MKVLQIIIAYLLGCSSLWAQNSTKIIQDFLNEHQKELGLTQNDISNWTITSQHQSQQSGASYTYIRQSYNGIDLSNGTANFAIKAGKVVSMGNRLVDHIAKKIQYTTPSIKPNQAIKLAAKALNLPSPVALKVIDAQDHKHFIYNKGGISLENIPVKLSYFARSTQAIHLAWELSIYEQNAQHWWSVLIDAQTGALLHKNDWVTHCRFDGSPFAKCKLPHTNSPNSYNEKPNKTLAPDQYTVFALPLESAAHGVRSVVTNPADPIASPYGWHDTNGANGAEYTITRGNNVYAYEDTSNTNSPGYSPDGGANLEFNFPFNNAAQPPSYIDAAVTNLFYMNNAMHDIWYRYGFDEASGNFQANNYGNGGQGGDYVRAETQDGSGTNNANFATPNDGNRPRMQMYVWPFSSSIGHFLTVNAPSNITGTYLASTASFGPSLPPVPVTGNLVLLEDVTAPIHDGCDSIINANQLNGKIVLIDQGTCGFTDKIQAAQNAGALAVIIANNMGFLFVMGGTSSSINIPSIMILPADANALKAELLTGNVSVSIDNAGISNKDSDLDNGIIAHEYGHGISNRLTGGANNSNCLHNAEQMGEGWSDWFGLMLTIEPGDQGTDVRGIGTYVKGQPNTGDGIRPAPYSTDWAVNGYTYANSNNVSAISQPHGVGFIFATALWDLTWALIDAYGGVPDPDLYNGTGGNNIAMNLVIEGLKLQPCNPGMIDGRDAILQADQLLYNGAHECLIWEVFAKRGFGYSASQGSSASRSDQVEAFDLSPVCLIPSAPPVAAFTPSALNSCVSSIQFTDSSYMTPHQWFWDFGDGVSSTQQNPTHAYQTDGNYTVTLIVSNPLGSDTTSQQITIALPPPPVAISTEICAGDSALLVATGSGTIQWKNVANHVIQQGDTLWIPNLGTQHTYYAENITGAPHQFIGALDSTIGNGGFTNAYGALNFRADQALELVSTWVYANGAGNRTFFLASGTNTTGTTPNNIVDDATVYLVDGFQQVNLNLMVPDSGFYNLGGENLHLYRNTTGANYPYTSPNLMSINSSSSTTAPNTTYYYFYNLEVREPRCVSAQDTAYATPVLSYFTYTNTNNTFTFSDGSAGATSWHWSFGDGSFSTLPNPTHTYADGNPYTVTLTINGGTCSSTQVINDIVGINTPNDATIPMITLSPNPSKNWANILLNKASAHDLTVQVSGIDGRVLQTATLERGTTQFTLNLEQLPSAMYIVRIQGLNFTEIRKLVVE
ncbi:T9SS-dependent M36 family metallopeptidase [Aureispira anguillae]|uniref:T9SS-dependent M36 family metallopeptidase n=1 Tax=Aureispira anguillae TaxID=2864201 RepID=A0A916DRM6_9BACT|nr:T9SS-dependent M36 family metallopeptidase [Aureispira anguillae]BDS10497.1 T9SS-dependent M36 family metallopeptidase [Aureispira anguillae]